MVRVFQRDSRLLQNLARDVFGVADDNSTRIDQLETAAFVSRETVEAVPRDSGLVAHDGAALSGDPVEERGLADVGTPHDDYRGRLVRHELS